jgi:heptosyltransferase-3
MNHLLKQLELGIRRLYLRQTERPFTGELITTPQNVLTTETPRILLLRQDRIGDVICSTPIIAALRARFPAAQLDILLSRNNAVLAPILQTWCNHTVHYAKTIPSYLLVRQHLRQSRYDVVVDLMDNPSTTSTMFVRATRAPMRLGILKENAWVYTHCVPLLDRARYHYIERIAQLLLPFGIDPASCPLDVQFPLSDHARTRARALLALADHPERARFVLIHISSRHQTLRWELQRYMRVAAMLREQFPELAIGIGAASDDQLQAAWIAEQVSGAFTVPQCSFEDYAAVLAHAALLISPDTAIVHVAAAFKIPAVVMYHQPNAALMPWYPYRSPYRALVERCGDSINIIEPDDVARAAAELLTGQPPAHAERIFAAAFD